MLKKRSKKGYSRDKKRRDILLRCICINKTNKFS